MQPEVSIIGAGAVGVALADALVKAGVRTELVVRPGRREALNQRGVWIKWEGRSVQPVQAAITLAARARVLVFAVKTFALPQALAQHASGKPKETEVVALQNGLSADVVLREKVRGPRRIGGIVSFSATSLRDGEVTVLAKEPKDLFLTLGEDDGEVRSSETFSLFSRAITVSVSQHLEGARWSKLLLNLGNGLLAATALPASRFFAHPYGAYVATRTIREGLLVARAAGVKLEALPHTPRVALWAARALPFGFALRVVRRRAARTIGREADLYGSTLQSVLRHEPTEIDELNGAVVRLAAPLGIPVPTNDATTLAVRAVSRGEPPLTVEALAQV